MMPISVRGRKTTAYFVSGLWDVSEITSTLNFKVPWMVFSSICTILTPQSPYNMFLLTFLFEKTESRKFCDLFWLEDKTISRRVTCYFKFP